MLKEKIFLNDFSIKYTIFVEFQKSLHSMFDELIEFELLASFNFQVNKRNIHQK
jgi:hypothetical protein